MASRPLVVLLVCVCTAAAQPVITSISPSSALTGGPGFTLNVFGSGFSILNTVRWNQLSLPTTFVSGAQLIATVSASLIAPPADTHIIRVRASAISPVLSNSLTFTELNPIPALTSISPTSAVSGTNFTLTANGSDFVPTSEVRIEGAPLSTVIISSTQISAVVAAASVPSSGSYAITVANPSPGGGISAGHTLSVVNPSPTLSAISPATVTATTAGLSLVVTGDNFVSTSAVLLDGSGAGVTTNFVSRTQLTATIIPSLTFTGALHTVTVRTNLPGGGPDQVVILAGSGFVSTTAVNASGVPLSTTFLTPTQVRTIVPAFLRRAVRVVAITAVNPAPGGGAASTPLVLNGPAIASCTPAVIPVLGPGSPNLTLTVSGGFFVVGDGIRINGVPRATTFVNSATLSCGINGALAVTQQPGGFAVTVTRQGTPGTVTSNAVGVTVGVPETPDNAGTVSVAPRPPAPGEGFNLRVETPVVAQPLTLVAAAPAPPAILLNVAHGFDLVLGPGLSGAIVLADGLGMFGSQDGSVIADYDLSFFGIPSGRGVFEIPGLVAPSSAVGITVSLAAFYIDPGSPVGANATHVSGPYSL